MAMEYHLTDHRFSREWRRGKRYSKHELRWLARKKGLEFVEYGGAVKLVNRQGKTVANFAQKAEVVEATPQHPLARVFAALAVGKTIFLLLSAQAHGEIITAFCACANCCGSASGMAADGSRVRSGIIAAPRSVPFGTRVVVEGVGSFTVRDRTAKRYDGRWDIYMPTHWKAVQFGKQERRVYVLR